MSQAPQEPLAAVVIPTRARETRLAFALEALSQQSLAPERFEVVIVRDEDDRGWRTPPPAGLRMRTITLPGHPPPAEKRNAGWRSSRAELIAFTDDDCRPSPGWLEGLVEAWAEAARAPLVIQGAVAPDPDEAPLLTGLARSLEVESPDGWYQTANLALPRTLLERIGGFDESLNRTGEDTDLALRAAAGGAEAVFAERALVWHAVHTRTLPWALRDVARADGVAELIRRHPDLRRRVFLRFFWKRSHAALCLALAGLALGRPRGALLAGLPYLASNYDRSVPPSPKHVAAVALHLPSRFLLDLFETLQTARGALRSRTPLL
jgi:glycosyltransferase involved in cell wall biosynthesis